MLFESQSREQSKEGDDKVLDDGAVMVVEGQR